MVIPVREEGKEKELEEGGELLAATHPKTAQELLDKWSTAKARNSTAALSDLEALGPNYDTEDCKDALLEYRGIDRSDYSDTEEYQEARDEAWDNFIESLDTMAGEEEEEEEEPMSPAIQPKVTQRIPTRLRPLAEEAVKYDTFDEFETAFLRDIKHGRYYHVTDNPNFTIDPLRGPRDMSSMAGQAAPQKGKLMITSDLGTWAEEYKGTRQYVAIIDMSQVPKNKYWQVNRGFGNELWVDDPSMAKVIKVVPMKQAKVDARLHQNALEERITGSTALENFYNEVKGIESAQMVSTQVLNQEPKNISSEGESNLRVEIKDGKNPGEKILSAYLNSQIAGQLSMIEGTRTITIAMIYTEVEFRGRGIGGALVKTALEYAGSVGKSLLSGSLSGAGTRLLRNLEKDVPICLRMPTTKEESEAPEFRNTMVVIESPGSDSRISQEGKDIARQLGNGVIYNGPQMDRDKFVGHVFTDAAVTGTTFMCNDLEGCKARLAQVRERFGAAPPITLQPRVIKRIPTDEITVNYKGAIVTGKFQEVLLRRPDELPNIEISAVSRGRTKEDFEEAVNQVTERLNAMIEYESDQWPVAGRGEESGRVPAKQISKARQAAEVYPIRISMFEYNRSWKPKGWKIIIIGPTETWREDWGVWEAIRDIVQNALDETEEYQYGYDDLGLWIGDHGKGIAIANFLLGPPRLKPNWARGKYGEGMKISSLALLREGFPVKVDTVGREVRMVFLEQDVGGDKISSLAALWKEGGTKTGTIFHIIGYRGDAHPDCFVQNLPKSQILSSGPSSLIQPILRMNSIIKTDEAWESSRIYARDIFMDDTSAYFSYNLWDFELAPDRFAPKNHYAMWCSVAHAWQCCDDVELLQTLLKIITSPPLLAQEGDEEYAEFQSLPIDWSSFNDLTIYRGRQQNYQDILKLNYKAWQNAWTSLHGMDAVLRTSSSFDPMVKHLGYKSVSLSNGTSGLAAVLPTDAALVQKSQERLREVMPLPDNTLSARQFVHLTLARAITKDVRRAVTNVWAAQIPSASDRVRTAGLYSKATREIFIAPDQLDSGRKTIDTLLHELAHDSSGAEDGDPKHYSEISSLAGIVVNLVHTKSYDDFILKVDFQWY